MAPSGARALLAFLVVGAAVTGHPQEAAAQRIEGRVLDSGTLLPVAGARIRVLGDDTRPLLSLMSDSAGSFHSPLPPGRYRLSAEHPRYPSVTSEPLELTRGEEVTIELRLGPLPIEMEPLLVQSRIRRGPPGVEAFYRRMERQRAIGQGRFITREEIDRSSQISVNDLLARDPALHGVRVTVPRFLGDPGRMIVAMRHAGRECVPQLYMDGVPFGVAEPNWRVDTLALTDLSNLFHPDMLEGVEIYRSPAETPPEMRREGCGVVALWTRPRAGSPFNWRRLAFAAGWVGATLFLVRHR